MRTLALVLGLLAGGFGGVASPVEAKEKPAPFSLSYTHAGLTEITVKDGKLLYVWHTPRRWDGDDVMVKGGLESYDRHQIDVWLTDRELGRFQDWVARHKVFAFDKDYPSAAPPDMASRAAAFKSGLSVVHGDKRRVVSWVGDSKTPKELETAVKELASLADEIQGSRSK
jgi:hypothetical protein